MMVMCGSSPYSPPFDPIQQHSQFLQNCELSSGAEMSHVTLSFAKAQISVHAFLLWSHQLDRCFSLWLQILEHFSIWNLLVV